MAHNVSEETQIGGSEAWLPAVRGYVALAEKNHSEVRSMPFGWDDPVLYIKERGKVVAVLAYRVQGWCGDIFILLTWVDAKHRRRGMYRALYERLKAIRDDKHPAFTITSGIALDNHAMIDAAEATGRKLLFAMYRDVPTPAKRGKANGKKST